DASYCEGFSDACMTSPSTRTKVKRREAPNWHRTAIAAVHPRHGRKRGYWRQEIEIAELRADIRSCQLDPGSFTPSLSQVSPLSVVPPGIIAPTFPPRSRPWLLTKAACGGLGSAT